MAGQGDESTVKALIDSMDVSGWNLSNEREFLENLYVGRFSSFLLVFSLFLTAGFANSFEEYRSFVFYAGAWILFLVWLPLNRAYQKHDRVLRIIFLEKPEHPAAKLKKVMEAEGFRPRFIVSRLMGWTIPWTCILVLTGTGVAVSCGLLN